MRPLFCFIGESGSGKDFLANELVANSGIKKVLSYTTRPPRNNNRDRISHFFVTEDDYLKAKSKGEIAAETHFDGNYYWATYKQLDESNLYILDPAGYFNLVAKYQRRIVPIYIYCREEIRAERMKKRGDSADAITTRLLADNEMFSTLDDIPFEIMIYNDGVLTSREIIYRLRQAMAEIEKEKGDDIIVIK